MKERLHKGKIESDMASMIVPKQHLLPLVYDIQLKFVKKQKLTAVSKKTIRNIALISSTKM